MIKALKLSSFFLALIFFTQTSSARKITLKWNLDQSMLAYEIQVAKDIGFKKVLQTKRVQDPKIELDLPIGTFFYRVRYIDKDNDPLYWSKSRKINITPLSLEPLTPESDHNLIYYEINPEILFSWSSKEKNKKETYQLVVIDAHKKEVINQIVKEKELKINHLAKGEYQWKVRSIYKKVYKSEYTKLQKFTVTHKELEPPTLVFPTHLKHQIKANKSFHFAWEKDLPTNFTDIKIYNESSAENLNQNELNNITETSHKMQKGLPAGHYTWSVTTKEGQTTPGISSEKFSFGVYPHIIEKGGFKVEYGLGRAQFVKETRTQRTTPASDYTVKEDVNLHEISLYYIFTNWIGIGADWQLTTSGDDPWGERFHRAGGYLHFFGGSSFFSNLVSLGYREMVEYEAYINSDGVYTPFTMYGVALGDEATWALSRKIKFSLKLQYFRPLEIKESVGTLNADVLEYGGMLSYNVWDMLWVNLSYRVVKTVGKFKHIEDGVNYSYFTTERTEPMYFSVSYNY